MKAWIVSLGKFLLRIGIGILGATLYGILNDQITVTLSPEYFSVFKRAQFADVLEIPAWGMPLRLQAVIVGTLATWWFGLLLGGVLGIISMVGRQRALLTRDYVRAVAGIMAFTLVLSMAFGLFGYLIEPVIKPTSEVWPFLTGIHVVRPAFAVGAWHDGAYLGGGLGTLLACFWVRRRRRSLASQSAETAAPSP